MTAPNTLLDGYQLLRKELGKSPWTPETDNWREFPNEKQLSKEVCLRLGLDPKYGHAGMIEYGMRDLCIKRYGFAIPTDEALEAIAAYGPVVEIGAGLGYWAHLLRDRIGASVVCYDKDPVETGRNFYSFKKSKAYIEVLEGGPEVLSNHPTDTLLLIWPNYDEPFADQCLQEYKGDTVAYVGEGAGGCTGDDIFHARLEREWHVVETVSIPQWWAIHDYLTIFQRGAVGVETPTECTCDTWSRAACLYCWRQGRTVNLKRET